MPKNPFENSTHKFGLGLRSPHYNRLEENLKSEASWFEVISENYFRTKGRPFKILEKLRGNYPIACHGVSLSIASFEEFDQNYLDDLKTFYNQIDPFIVSDHLCFTGMKQNNLHNLLPFAFNQENLIHISNRIDQVQNKLGRKMAFENLSAYFDYQSSTMSEWDFINQLLKMTDCNLLLDLNNLYVNSYNHQYSPDDYLSKMPFDRVSEIHLAGFSEREGFYFDTHSKPLYPELIELYKKVLKTHKSIPTLYEWDEDIPTFEILESQITTLKAVWMSIE